MKSTGIVRKIDELGRIILPIELAYAGNRRPGFSGEIFIEDNTIMLKISARLHLLRQRERHHVLSRRKSALPASGDRREALKRQIKQIKKGLTNRLGRMYNRRIPKAAKGRVRIADIFQRARAAENGQWQALRNMVPSRVPSGPAAQATTGSPVTAIRYNALYRMRSVPVRTDEPEGGTTRLLQPSSSEAKFRDEGYFCGSSRKDGGSVIHVKISRKYFAPGRSRRPWEH